MDFAVAVHVDAAEGSERNLDPPQARRGYWCSSTKLGFANVIDLFQRPSIVRKSGSTGSSYEIQSKKASISTSLIPLAARVS